MFYYLVKLKGTQYVDVFESNENYDVKDEVLVSSDRGLEVGQITRIMHPMQAMGQVESKAHIHDVEKYWQNIEQAEAAKVQTEKRIQENNLEMKVFSVHYNLDQSKIFIDYTAEERIDFRNLLKDLSQDFKTRIELSQLGARDYAKLVGGIGVCGRECCCSFKKDFQSITMNMAKNQMLPLNNEALSGVCGSLKCCLAYENDQYFECRKNFPRIKSKVTYNDKEYQVQDFNCISEKVLLTSRDERIYVSVERLKGAS